MRFDRGCSTIAGASLGAIVLFGMAVAGPASAQVIDGDFHTSDGVNNTGGFFGWTLDGNNQVQTNRIGSGPTGGDTYQAFIQNADTNAYAQGGNSVAAGTADDNATHFETFVGVSAAQFTALIPVPVGTNPPVQTVTAGSAIQQVVNLKTGDKITFDYDFLANGANGFMPPYAPYQNTTDIAFVHITDGTANTLSLLGNTTTSTFLPSQTPVSDPLLYQTGYTTYSFTAPETGTYTLSIGDELGGGGDVALLVDNVTYTPFTPNGGSGGGGTTPEPGMAALLGGLLVSGTVLLRRPRR